MSTLVRHFDKNPLSKNNWARRTPCAVAQPGGCPVTVRREGGGSGDNEREFHKLPRLVIFTMIYHTFFSSLALVIRKNKKDSIYDSKFIRMLLNV